MNCNDTANITDEKAMELLHQRMATLREKTDFFDTLFKTIGGYAIVATDFDGTIQTYNEEVIKWYGYKHEEIIGWKMNLEVFFPKGFIETERLQQAIENTLAKGTYFFEEENVRRDGSLFPVQMLLAQVKSREGTMYGFIMIVEDLTERKRWEREIKKLNEELEHRVVQRTAQLGDTVKKLETEVLVRKRAEAEIKKLNEELECRVIERTAQLGVTVKKLEAEIYARKQTEEALRNSSFTDPLTKLYNRRGFMAFAMQALKITKRTKAATTLFFADIDGLKWINDNMGHAHGDMAIIDAANMLRSVFRESDIIARMGGDEFAVVSMEDGLLSASAIASRLQKNIEAHNTNGSRDYRLSMSVGMARQSLTQPKSIDDMLNEADKLMYEQKREKKIGVVDYRKIG